MLDRSFVAHLSLAAPQDVLCDILIDIFIEIDPVRSRREQADDQKRRDSQHAHNPTVPTQRPRNFFSSRPPADDRRETVLQLLGRRKSPFSSVAFVQLFENNTLVTAFVTDEHDDGSYTVFVPTGPNPTSGQIFHLEGRFVHPIAVGVDDTMRSIISCGAGSSTLISAMDRGRLTIATPA